MQAIFADATALFAQGRIGRWRAVTRYDLKTASAGTEPTDAVQAALAYSIVYGNFSSIAVQDLGLATPIGRIPVLDTQLRRFVNPIFRKAGNEYYENDISCVHQLFFFFGCLGRAGGTGS
ncbi:MAG: hypothetical protein ACRER2_05230 [Methylococcales bacterium]